MDTKPIKRSECITELSKDDHAGLLFCWKIKEGLKRNIELHRINKYINFFWAQHLKAHFQEEEALLFNRVDDPVSRQGKTEHLMLIERLNGLNYYENENRAEYLSFAELLIKHIRFEERELFPYLELTLSTATLKSIGEYLAKQHAVPFKDNYTDEFWTFKERR
jgi:hemerythrin-like domain-containing protein